MKKPFGIRLPDKQLEILKEIAEREGRSVSDVMRRMIDEEIKRKADARRFKGMAKV